METESDSSTIAAAQKRQIPDELLQKLHAATERFHQARQRMEQSVNSSEYTHQHGVDQATDQMRVAEREVEEITLQIHSSMTPPPPVNPAH